MALNVDECFDQWTIYDTNQNDIEVARQVLLEGNAQIVSYDYEKLYVAGNLGFLAVDENNYRSVDHIFHNDCDIATDFKVNGIPVFVPDSIPRSDVSGSDVSGSDASGSDVSGSDVSGSDVSGSDVSGTILIVNPYFEEYGMKISVVSNGKCVKMNNDFRLIRCALCPCSTRIRFTFTDGGREFLLTHKAYLVEESIRNQLMTECIASGHCYKDMMLHSLS